MPEKLTTAPISERPLLRAAISLAMSKSASWIRMVTSAVMESCSTAGHRREKGDLAGAGDHGIRFDMGVVDRSANHLRRLKGVRVGVVALGQPRHQVCHGAHVRRRLNHLFRLADPFAFPCEIFQLHPSSSLMR